MDFLRTVSLSSLRRTGSLDSALNVLIKEFLFHDHLTMARNLIKLIYVEVRTRKLLSFFQREEIIDKSFSAIF